MRVLLVNPPDVDGRFTDREDRHAGFCSGLYPPYTAASILAVVRQQVPEAELLGYDARLENPPPGEVIRKIHSLKPDLIICLVGCYTIAEDRPYAELPYPTIGVMCPSSVDAKEAISLFDLKTPCWTKTEIENTVALAVREFAQTGEIRTTPGMVLRRGDEVVDTGEPQQQAVSGFPVPAFDLFPMEDYFRLQRKIGWHWEFGGERYLWMVTSKGCVKHCTYCSSGSLKPFFKTPEQVVNELRHYIETYQVRCFDFIDSEFTVNLRRAKELCRAIIDAKLNITWVAHNIIEMADDELMRLCAEAGCIKLKYGLETGDPATQQRICKVWTMEQARKAFTLTKQHGMQVQANFMVGFLGETKASLRRTHRAFAALEPDVVCSSILFPTPSTPFYEELKDKGLLVETNWSEYKKYGKMVFKHDTYRSWEEILKAFDWLEGRIAVSLAWKRLFRHTGQRWSLKCVNLIKADPNVKRFLVNLPVIGAWGTQVSRRLQHEH